MQLHTFLIAALDHVLNWELPDDACQTAVPAEAAHLAGLDSDDLERADLD